MPVSLLLFLAAIAPAEPDKAVTVGVGQADWDRLVPLQIRPGPLDGGFASKGLRRIIRDRKCDLPGVTENDFGGLTVRFAALIQPNGKTDQIVVEQRSCLELEGIVGSMALQMTKRAKVDKERGPTWYAGRVIFKN